MPYDLVMLNLFSKVTARVMLTSLLVMSALPTLGQIGQEPVEPAPESASWMAFLLAILFGVAVAIGCLMSPKRTHQD